MFDAIAAFFNSDNFMPHGHCFQWFPQILWLHVVSDVLIAASYYSIPITLIYFTRRRTDAPFRFIFYLFGAFILFCGTTHLLEIWVIWHPDYAFEGVVKALTALTSVFTAFICWRIMPLALLLKSPAELSRVNAQLEETNHAIERRVEERTHELQAVTEQLRREIAEKEAINDRLEESRTAMQSALSAANAANEAKSEFLANISHELRTPMNAIVGLSDIMDRNRIDPEKQKEFIKTIRVSAATLMDLLNDLLDLAKLESAKMELEIIPFDLERLSREVIQIQTSGARAKGIDLTLNFDPKLAGSFLGDPLRLRQILMNLLSNAVKFTEKGWVNMHLSPCGEENDQVCIEVADTGIGIPEDMLESIFGKFVQADTSVTRKYGGSGLGLAICQTLVQLMHGSLTVESRINEGSRFYVTLPLTRG